MLWNIGTVSIFLFATKAVVSVIKNKFKVSKFIFLVNVTSLVAEKIQNLFDKSFINILSKKVTLATELDLSYLCWFTERQERSDDGVQSIPGI